MRRVVGSAVLFLACLLPGMVLAQKGYSPVVKMGPESDLAWNIFTGQYRFLFHHIDPYRLDAEGTASPMQDWGEHRLRYSPALAWEGLGIRADIDFFGGQLFGDHEDLAPDCRRLDRRATDTGLSSDGFLVRQLFVQFHSPIGLLKVGQMTSEYGLGIIANSGEEDDSRFGVRRYGDIVERILFMTTPFKPLQGKKKWGEYLTLFASGDLVYQDENAVEADGDRAAQVNVGLYYRHPSLTNGVVFTYRSQTDADGDVVKAYLLNANGRNRMVAARRAAGPGKEVPALTLFLDYELVYLTGHTNRFQQLGSPDGLEVNSLGFAGRLGFETWFGLDFEAEVGYASGDNNPYDDESHAFFFDPDYNVGLVFFEEMLPLITARSVEISADPAHNATSPKGLDLVPTQGRVTNAVYLLPQLRYSFRPRTRFVEKLQVMAGPLFIFTPARLSHGYYTFENGGVATNHLGRQTDSDYVGCELLAGLRAVFWPFPEHIGLAVRLDQSYFIPGDALADPDGEKPDGVWKIIAGASLLWR
jgi:hypothetical protein